MPLRLRTTWAGIGGTPFMSTMYFAGETQTAADEAASAVSAFWGAVDNLIDSGLAWTLVREVVQLDLATGLPEAMYTVAAATGTGSVSGNQVPFASQAIIRWRTGTFLGGRELRGRTFIPGLQGGSADGTVPSATITAFETAAAALIADADSEMVIWSRTKQAQAPVASGTCWNQFGVLRSRRPSFAS